mgnify:CR=1 FL=1
MYLSLLLIRNGGKDVSSGTAKKRSLLACGGNPDCIRFQKIVMPANIVGKLTTVFMSLALFSCFFHNAIKPVDFILVITASTPPQ